MRPTLVLLDLNLPGDTGWDLLRGPALARPRAPAGRRRQRDHASARSGWPRFAVAGYLPKPFPLETLVATVERCIHRREGQTNR